MIRPVTCVCMLMAAGSGLYLYQAKHQAQLVTREIRRLHADAETTRQRAGVLLAEYQLENDPTRLGDLSERFLPQLKATLPTQFTTMAEIERKLPPVGVPAATGQAPLEPDQPFAYPPAPSAPATAPSAVPMARVDPPHDDAKPDAVRTAASTLGKPVASAAGTAPAQVAARATAAAAPPASAAAASRRNRPRCSRPRTTRKPHTLRRSPGRRRRLRRRSQSSSCGRCP